MVSTLFSNIAPGSITYSLTVFEYSFSPTMFLHTKSETSSAKFIDSAEAEGWDKSLKTIILRVIDSPI